MTQFRSYNKPKLSQKDHKSSTMKIIQQTDDFYDYQDLAFAQDYELKAVTAKLVDFQ